MMLYKYSHPARVQDVLYRRLLRFTPPMHLNDPFESLPYYAALAPDRAGLIRGVARTITGLSIEERLRLSEPLQHGDQRCLEEWFNKHPKEFDRLMADWNPNGELLKEVAKEVYAAMNSIGILSLSAVPDNVIMWSHYADQHRGFVIEFNSSDSFFQKYSDRSEMLEICRRPQPVQYVAQRPKIDLESMTEVETFLTKVDDWSYEQEWRFGRGLSDADSRDGDVHLFEFPASCVSSVVMGCKMPFENKREIISLVRNNREFKHVRVRQAVRSHAQYAITLLDLIFDAMDIDKH